MQPQMVEILLCVGYLMFLFCLLLVIVNWPAIRKFFIRVGDILLAIGEAYCEYEEERYLFEDTNLFI
jgi:hypothetical protein